MVFGPMKIFCWRVMATRTSFSLTNGETFTSAFGAAGVSEAGLAEDGLKPAATGAPPAAAASEASAGIGALSRNTRATMAAAGDAKTA